METWDTVSKLEFLIQIVEMLDKNLLSDDNVLRTKVLIEVNEDFHQADLVN